MKNKLYRSFLILLITLYSSTYLSAYGRSNLQDIARSDSTAIKPARASPGNTTRCSIKMVGRSNTIILNGKVLATTPNFIKKPIDIRVTGEGNTVTIHQNDQTSEVTITQKGKSNQIRISQINNLFLNKKHL